ncbi:MAG: hypothetical protein NTX38_18720 [Methylobacter sp.]|nr:hypothetical protein [Methylobacter sp.]
MKHNSSYSLPSTEELLITGGDERIALNTSTGLNKYGCQPFPDPELLAFSSSTASVISAQGYAAASQLHTELLMAIDAEPYEAVYNRKMKEIRLEWLQLCELSDLPELELIFSPSGTETHALVAQYAGRKSLKPTLIIMVEANETGSGVISALNEHTSNGKNNVEIAQIAIRLEDGTPRLLTDIDTEVEMLVAKAVAAERRVLLILVDQSKTGLIAPSPACVIALHNQYTDVVEVLIDACQFRIGLPTLRAYLDQEFMVALTGSKFLTAPSFSAVLLLPGSVASRFQKNADLKDQPYNFGLLLRIAVALEELRRFRAVPEVVLIRFMQDFAKAIKQRLSSDPYFEALPVLELDRQPLTTATNWDHLQTIFPFLLFNPQTDKRTPLSREQTGIVYQQLMTTLKTARPDPFKTDIASTRCQFGQPVACGIRNDIPVSALRLCLSSRLIAEASTGADKSLVLIKQALKALDKTTLLIQQSE